MLGQALMCLCLLTFPCPVLGLTKIDLQNEDVGSKNKQEKKVSLSLSRYSKLN